MRNSQKHCGLDNQQLSPDEGKAQRLLPAVALGASAPKWEPPKLSLDNMVNDIVCTLMKVRENLFLFYIGVIS